ncbi:HAMP domain-containing sensor histidine kinase [Paenibacillus sp. YYML68]|uniref:sensor histidine kinase n=1 Tax=Paenibacillus sp. YYML68 TaxID=2909250 RepID=UPI00249055F0|nr:HAMP domain-containing sensor histidine kinase [Paenibacillus sp. YYML68]
MRVTKRFFLLNVISVLLALVVTVLAVIVFAAIYTRVIGQKPTLHELQRSYEKRAAIEALKREAQSLPFEQLLDRSWQQAWTERATAVGAHLVVLRNRGIVYTTAPFHEVELKKAVMLTEGAAASEHDTVELSGKTYMFARASYPLTAGDEGTLLLVARVQPHTGLYGTIALGIVCFFVAVFVLLNLWVTYRFSRGTLRPLERLRAAAVKISEGDLDGGIAEEGEDEVRELCRALERMRLKLKESIYLQRKYDENRSFLVSSISHDLKTPVTSIIGYIEGIMDGVATTPEKVGSYLETARAKALLVNTMIDDLLLFSKLDLNQLPYHFERVKLAAYFDDCAEEHRCDFDKLGVKLELRHELAMDVTVLMDRERMRRVMQNVLDNAAKYVPKPGGEVVMILRETRTSAIIEIRDNGQGIPEDDLPHIFDRFYRVDASRNQTDGSGLGLAIAKQIVEGHDGKIWARSTLGEGTRMMISLKKV